MLERREFLRLIALAFFGTLAPLRSLHAQHRTTKMSHQGITLFLSGDVMTGRGIDQVMTHPSRPQLYEPAVTDARDYIRLAEAVNGPIPRAVQPGYIWGDLLQVLNRRSPALRIINLETAITRSDDHQPKGINYRMNPANISCLTAAAIDCCVLANNHVLDWGVLGLKETLATLTKVNIKYSGAGHNLEEAKTPAIMALPNGGRVVLLSFGMNSSGIPLSWEAAANHPGVNLIHDLSATTVNAIAQQVHQIKALGDIVIASIHWGGNWGYDISRDQRTFAHALIDDASVDLIHGHSSHHPKGIEVYNEHLILYGCGDLINDYEGIGGYEEYRGELGLAYFPTLDQSSGKLLRLALTPTRLKKFRLNRASNDECKWLAEMLTREGAQFGTTATIGEEGDLSLSW